MNRLFASIITFVLATMGMQAQEKLPQLGVDPIEKVIAAMTTQEKAELVVGSLWINSTVKRTSMTDFSAYPYDFRGIGMPIGGVPRLGIPITLCSDGSYGLKRYLPGKDGKYNITAFPSPFCIACSWNKDMQEKVYTAYGYEGREYGIDVLLGPAMNIHRDPLCGRNFEYYSEDPLLAGVMGTAAVKGIQSNGIGTTPKHFAVNNQETDRIYNDARLTTRALREIYLRGFERVVKEAKPWMLMTSYNKINGIYSTENREFMQNITRGEWGFDGCFMTDFGGKGYPAVQVAAGTNMVMPGSRNDVEDVLEGLKNGELTMAELDNSCKYCLEYILKSPHFKKYAYSFLPQVDNNRKLAAEAAADSYVLLKNNDNTLPLTANTHHLTPNTPSVAFFGTASYYSFIAGIGSGRINTDYRVNMVDKFTNNNATVKQFYTAYIDTIRAHTPKPTGIMALINGSDLNVQETAIPQDVIDQAAKQSSVAIMTIGRCAGEGADRKPIEGDWLLSQTERQNMKAVSEAFHKQGKKLVVVLNINGIIEMASWRDMADAILVTWIPGMEGGTALYDVLTGNVCPSGRMSSTVPMRYEDCPTYGNFPSEEPKKTTAVEDNGFQMEMQAKKKQDQAKQQSSTPNSIDAAMAHQREPRRAEADYVKNQDYTNYEEDVYVGYRYYDTFKKDVAYPFGFGLSYTTFSYGALKPATFKNGEYTYTMTVTNTGKVAGKDVVQLYAAAPQCSEGRPVHELVAFEKTRMLNPGESQTVTLHFTDKELSWYCDSKTSWMLEKGNYTLTAASSSRDAQRHSSCVLNIKKAKVVEKTTASCRPQHTINVLKNK